MLQTRHPTMVVVLIASLCSADTSVSRRICEKNKEFVYWIGRGRRGPLTSPLNASNQQTVSGG